jgi:capsular exopolysaccharide synthesis family protein
MRVATAVVQEMGLNRDPNFLANSPAGENAKPVEVPLETAAQVLLSRLEIEPEKQSRLVTVAFEDADPVRAQRIVSMVIQKYQDQNLDRVLASTTSAVDWLRGQLAKLKTELENNELALHGYKKDNNILSVSLDDQSNMLRGEMTKLNELLTGVKAHREEVHARLVELKKVDAKDPTKLPASELLKSPILQSFRESYMDAVRERDGLLGEGKGANHPSVSAAHARVAASRTALLAEVTNIQKSVEREHAAVGREAGGLQRLYDAANKRALELTLMEIQYNRLRRSKDNTEKLYSLVLERTKESDLTRMIRVNNVYVVDDPLVPKAPVRPSIPVNVAIGLLAGLVLGIGVAVGREMLDRSIKTPDHIERDLRLPFLGLLPAVGEGVESPYGRKQNAPTPTGKPELVVHDQPKSGLAEAARAIRTNIVFMSPDSPHRVLLVTSAAPVEGKTTVASCIAVAMAQAGQRVALVDCDMRRPRLHRVFDRTNDVGLTSALLDINALDDAIYKTEVPNLSMIACGPIPPNPAELLHSEAFGKVLDALRARFDRVVIDSPPVIPVTDGSILSTRVDGTVFVVRAFRTSKDLARRAVRMVRTVGGNIVGTVLNGVSMDRPGYSYYYQGYYYRQGYSAEADSPTTKADDSHPPLAH